MPSKSFSMLGLQHRHLLEHLQFHLHEAQLTSLQEARDSAEQCAEAAIKGSSTSSFFPEAPRPFAQEYPDRGQCFVDSIGSSSGVTGKNGASAALQGKELLKSN